MMVLLNPNLFEKVGEILASVKNPGSSGPTLQFGVWGTAQVGK